MTFRRTAASLAWVALAACGSEETAPRIERVSPAAGSAGDSVDVIGARFCGPDGASVQDDGTCTAPPAGLVRIGDARAPVQMWTQAQITVAVPADVEPGQVALVVERDGESSNSKFFAVE